MTRRLSREQIRSLVSVHNENIRTKSPAKPSGLPRWVHQDHWQPLNPMPFRQLLAMGLIEGTLEDDHLVHITEGGKKILEKHYEDL